MFGFSPLYRSVAGNKGISLGFGKVANQQRFSVLVSGTIAGFSKCHCESATFEFTSNDDAMAFATYVARHDPDLQAVGHAMPEP